MVSCSNGSQLLLYKSNCAQIIQLLVEGNSLRAITRITGCSINTVTTLLIKAGAACADFHDRIVTGIETKRIECDEIWSFVYAKQKNVPEGKENAGDVWTWVAIDADTRLIVSWMVGSRDSEAANMFMQDVAKRLKTRVQLTTDGYIAYYEAVGEAFGSNIDYAQLVKAYGKPHNNPERRYSQLGIKGIEKRLVSRHPGYGSRIE